MVPLYPTGCCLLDGDAASPVIRSEQKSANLILIIGDIG